MGFFGGGGGASNFSELAGTAAVNQGGTGATTASGARTNLGAAAATHTHTASDVTDFASAVASALQAASAVGIGVAPTLSALDVQSTSGAQQAWRYSAGVYATATVESGGNFSLSGQGLILFKKGTTTLAYFADGVSQIRKQLSVNGSHNPAASAAFDPRSTTGPQAAFSYDGSNYLSVTQAGSGGDATIAGTGGVILNGTNRSTYIASPTAAEIRDILIDHGLMAAS